MADNKKKKRTYELDEATIVQLNQIVEVMKLREETGSDGKGVLFDFSDDMDGVWKRGDIFQSGIYTSELIL